MEAPIGVIDSGVGGLTVVKEMLSRLPGEPIVYIGDDARCPYGPRPAAEVIQFTHEMAETLADMGIKMLVVACNTATAAALDSLRASFSFPVVGVIEPGARAAVNESKTSEIAVLGTVGTVKSNAYVDAVLALSPRASVIQLACPDFVPIVESGKYKSAAASEIIGRTLRPFASESFDTVILGCTHYPLLEDHIRANLPQGTTIVSSAVETVLDVERQLAAGGLNSMLSKASGHVFYTTGNVEEFRSVVTDWLSSEMPDVRPIKLRMTGHPL